MKASQITSNPAFFGILALIALVCLVLILQFNSNTITGASAYFSEPTYCEHEQDQTLLECACGRARSTRGKAIRFSDLESRSVVLEGDWCLLRYQQDICSELCKMTVLQLANANSVRSPVGGRAVILSGSGGDRANYLPGHTRSRSYRGAYSYISGY